MTTVGSSSRAYETVEGLSVELADGVLTITMNRPDSLNSLTQAMLAGIADSVERAASDERVRVVRLKGAGRGFSSGAGIGEGDQNMSSTDSRTDVIDDGRSGEEDAQPDGDACTHHGYQGDCERGVGRHRDAPPV